MFVLDIEFMMKKTHRTSLMKKIAQYNANKILMTSLLKHTNHIVRFFFSNYTNL